MRRLGLVLAVWLGLMGIAVLLVGCAPEPAPPPSFLAAYSAVLPTWTPEEEAAWASLPRYAISATLDTNIRRVYGEEHVRFVNRHNVPLREICFRLFPNLPQQGGHMVVKSITTANTDVDHTFSANGTAVAVQCDPPLEPNQIAELILEFSVEYPDTAEGRVLFGQSQGILCLPDFYPILAPYTQRGWYLDTPPAFADAGFAESSFYQLSLTVPSNLVVVCTGTTITETTHADGQKTLQLVGGPIREFTFLASPDYERESTQAYGAVVTSYFLKQDRDAGIATLWRAASALRVYSDTYGAYPFSVMNIAEAPLTYHGMEYSMLNLLGIDLFRENRSDLRYLTIHEVAHQWWYGLLGNDPYNTAWLDEGLAEHSGYTYALKSYGRPSADELAQTRWQQPFTFSKEAGQNPPLAQPADAFLSGTMYEIMVYAKSALFFDALRQAVGDDTFYAILKEYVRRYRFQIVQPENFFDVAREVSGRDLTPLIQEWILTGQ